MRGRLLPIGAARAALRLGPSPSPAAALFSDKTIALAHELAGCAEGTAEVRLGAFVAAALVFHGIEQGSAVVPIGPMLERLPFSEREREALDRFLENGSSLLAVSDGGDPARRPIVLETISGERWLSTHRLHTLERASAEKLGKLVATIPVRGSIEGLDLGRLSAEQRAAVQGTVELPLTIVTGGPGTGKTRTVAGIVEAFVALGLTVDDLVIAAPTGKAANRLEQALAEALREKPFPKPMTLHRLLEYSPSALRFRRCAERPIKAKVAIVDECSMIDATLMDALLSALHPEARLVLLGDAQQLPSVEAGAVFRDLLSPNPPPGHEWTRSVRERHLFELTTNFRTKGCAIQALAAAIDAGATEALSVPCRPPAQLEFDGVERVDAADERALLDRWFERFLQGPLFSGDARRAAQNPALLERLLAPLARAHLLCATRESTEAINDALARRARRADRTPIDYVPGEPVMMLRNDHDRGLYNGDRGVVIQGTRDRELLIALPTPEGPRLVAMGGIAGCLERSYASTVHKAQGSEWDHVALVLPRERSPLLTRELVYTAVTRAKESVVLLGDEARLREGVERVEERWSYLGRGTGLPTVPPLHARSTT